MKSSNIRKKAIILGAGPTGLVSAWKLLENGFDVEVFEKNSLVGGMCRTWKWNDLRYTIQRSSHGRT